MTLLLVRHGETALNRARILQPADTPLSDTGRAQAAALARRLVMWQPTAIVASDLPRAWQTAQAVAAACGLDILPSPLLHERNFGDLRGLPYDALDHDPIASDQAPPGGESLAQFDRRVDEAFAFVLSRVAAPGPHRLVVVTHGLVIARLLARHARLPMGVVPGSGPNTGLTVLDSVPPHRIRMLNCAAHLQGLADAAPRGLSGG